MSATEHPWPSLKAVVDRVEGTVEAAEPEDVWERLDVAFDQWRASKGRHEPPRLTLIRGGAS